jgi:cytochrome c oxidase assembly protein subunit 15
MRPAALASLALNVLLVVTGGVVRLTASGLGCPTWPHCDAGSFVPQRALGIHGDIEFGNRMVTFVLAAVAVGTLVVAWGYGRRSVLWLSVVLALGVPVQAVVGGISVLTDLNPWVVALHLLVSMGMIGVAVVLVRRIGEGDTPAVPVVSSGVTWLTRAVFVAGWLVLYAGTIVTGSGPHAGAANAPRNGLDPEQVSQLHSDLVFLLVGLTAAVALVVWLGEHPAGIRRAATALVVLEVLQAVVGFVQYFTGLPAALVAVHLLGAALLSAVITWLVLETRVRPPIGGESAGASAAGRGADDREASPVAGA